MLVSAAICGLGVVSPRDRRSAWVWLPMKRTPKQNDWWAVVDADDVVITDTAGKPTARCIEKAALRSSDQQPGPRCAKIDGMRVERVRVIVSRASRGRSRRDDKPEALIAL